MGTVVLTGDMSLAGRVEPNNALQELNELLGPFLVECATYLPACTDVRRGKSILLLRWSPYSMRIPSRKAGYPSVASFSYRSPLVALKTAGAADLASRLADE